MSPEVKDLVQDHAQYSKEYTAPATKQFRILILVLLGATLWLVFKPGDKAPLSDADAQQAKEDWQAQFNHR